MAAKGQIIVDGARDTDPKISVTWNEYTNQVIVAQGSWTLTFSYDEIREVYKCLYFLFGRVAMPEIH